MNTILELIVGGQYETAWITFEAIHDPSATDERWAGYALAILGRGLEARDLLLKSRRRGCHEAGIELSFTQQSIGELARAQEALDRLDLETFAGLDRAFAERQSGMLALANGNYKKALSAFERAWVSAHDDDQGSIALPGIAQALAFVCSHLGHDIRSDHYYGFALERGSLAMRGSLLLARAASRINLDLLEAAESDLLAARPLLEGDAYSLPSLEYHLALLDAARGQWLAATSQFRKSLQLAQTVGNSVIECSAELGIASSFMAMNELDRARTHLDRAAKSCETPTSFADLALLEGELHLRTNQPALACEYFQRAVAAFIEQHAERSAGRANLWLAEAHLSEGNPQGADAALGRAAVIWRALRADSMLNEISSLPAVLEHLTARFAHPASDILTAYRKQNEQSGTQVAARLQLTTLGQVRLELNALPVRLELRRAPEVLAYLLRSAKTRPEGSSIQVVLLDLFPDVPQRQARLYFHQVRYELEKKIPGLCVPYNANSKTYTINCSFEITWDVLEFEAALAEQSPSGVTRAFKLYGPFMPQAEGEWLETERATLNAHALKLGLEWCKTWFERQQYGRCIQLATQLLEIDPLDESLNEHLVRATKALEGRVAARQTVKRLRQRFESELGNPSASFDSAQHGLEK